MIVLIEWFLKEVIQCTCPDYFIFQETKTAK